MENSSLTLRPIAPVLFVIFFLLAQSALSQEEKNPNPGIKIQGYVAVYHPINGYNTPENFRDSYIVGFPIGVIFFKNEKIGYSLEIFPFIQADSTGSKISKIVFHPGAVFKLSHGYSCAARVAFESTGRYGLTQVLTKAIVKTKTGALGVSLVLAERFGNKMPASISYGIGIGLSF